MSYYDRHAYLRTSQQNLSRSTARPNYHSRLHHGVTDDIFFDPPRRESVTTEILGNSSINLYSIISKFEALDALSSPQQQDHGLHAITPQRPRRVTRTKLRNDDGTQIRYRMGSGLRIQSLSRRPVFDGNSASRMSDARHFSGSTFTSDTKNATTLGFSGRSSSKFVFSRTKECSTPPRLNSHVVHQSIITPRSVPEKKRMTVKEMIEQFDTGEQVVCVAFVVNIFRTC